MRGAAQSVYLKRRRGDAWSILGTQNKKERSCREEVLPTIFHSVSHGKEKRSKKEASHRKGLRLPMII